MITRPDTRLEVTFTRSDDLWTTFRIIWIEIMDDGERQWERRRTAQYRIADLPLDVRQHLQAAWEGMKAHRDQVDPIQ